MHSNVVLQLKSSSRVRWKQIRQGLLPVKSLGSCRVLVHRASRVNVVDFFATRIDDDSLPTLAHCRAVSRCAKIQNLRER